MKLLAPWFIFLIFCSFQAFGQYYKTLPKGVRLFNTRYVKSEISSSYNRTQAETPYAVKIEATAENLEKIENDVVQEALNLFKAYPEAYKQLSLGVHRLEGEADVKVDVYAFAYGITNKVTAYVGVPLYDAKVKVNYSRSHSSTNDEVAEALQKEYGDDWAQTLGNIVDSIFYVDENIIQSALVNTLGYDELGTWEGTGPGDTEMGIMYNFLTREKYGLLNTFGIIAPTGYVDDPDLLQDIGFGDGQWDIFYEFGGGYKLADEVNINSWVRYTHQFASEKKLRVPYDEDAPISGEKQTFKEKLGNKINFGVSTNFIANDWLTITPAYLIDYTEKATYYSENETANRILANDSESYAQSFKFAAKLSTVNLYTKGVFPAPGDLKFSYQTMMEGKNTPKINLFEIDFRMYF